MHPDAHRLDFRADINGLRALAIALVVAFHAFPAGLPGGFVGVDVFFVISGYLISRIVLDAQANDAFSFLAFYGRRALRLLPALFAMLAATLAFGWISLYSFEFETLGKHVLGALAFVSNFITWHETGYFDVAALRKPLLHLWSLGVEEQFYLAFPALMFVARRRRWKPQVVIAAALLLSFAFNIYSSRHDPTRDFFDPAARVWEILLGSLLAARELATRGQPDGDPACRVAGRATAEGLAVAGLSLIALSAFGLDSTLRFPGWYALAPTAGAVLLIAAGPGTLVARHLLSNRAAQWLGRISYPLYLWHWPLLSFAALLQPAASTVMVDGGVVAGAVVLAWLTVVCIERPLAACSGLRAKRWLIATPALAIALFATTAFSAAGFPMRPISVAMHASLPSGSTGQRLRGVVSGCDVPAALETLYAYCQHDTLGPPRYALLGDSKAASLASALFVDAPARNFWLFLGGYKPGSTPVPVFSDAPEFEQHQASLRPAVAAIASDPTIQVVVLAAATRSLFVFPEGDSIAELQHSTEYSAALDGLDRTVTKLVEAHKKVVLLVDNPTFRDPVLCVSRTTSVAWIDALLNLRGGASSCQISRAGQLQASAKYRALLAAVAARHPDAVRIFDTLDDLCDPATAICSAMEGDHPLYSYSDHISRYAARKIARRLVPFIDAFADER